MDIISNYIQLTKPRIVLLFALTGLSAIILEGSLRSNPLRLWMICLGIILTAGSANALNQYLDRDIDAVMDRTRKKRPIPQGRVSAKSAFVFAIVIGVLATVLLWHYGTALAASIGVATILFYVCVYTMWLKRRTPYNIVIGGAAGATAPLIGWAAATGEISLSSFILFLIIFMWTPPHFWSLSLCVKDEYKKASVPMLPVVAGETETRRQIFLYTLLLVPLTLTLCLTQKVGFLYIIPAVLLGIEFIRRTARLKSEPPQSDTLAWKTFGYSIVYLLALYSFIIADALVNTSAHAAEKLPTELKDVGFQDHLGTKLDLSLRFRNEEGNIVPLSSAFDGKHPVLLFLVYYGCPNLCNFFINGALESLKELKKQSNWTPGNQFQIVTISIDPRENPQLASKKKQNILQAFGGDHQNVSKGWNFWVSELRGAPISSDLAISGIQKDTPSLLASQVGFRYKYDKDQNQYAHGAGMTVLTPDGRVSRYLYGIDFKPTDLRLALVEASGKKIGSLVDHLMLFCYNYDPKTRKYAFYAMNLMRTGAFVFVLILGAFLIAQGRRKGGENVI